jgi:predicted nucleotidyltransferase
LWLCYNKFMKRIDLKTISEDIKPIMAHYDVRYAGVFGSYARGSANDSSDVDILVDFNKPISLIDFFDMKESISKKLEKEIDVVSEKAMVPYFKDYILKDLKIVYGER